MIFDENETQEKWKLELFKFLICQEDKLDILKKATEFKQQKDTVVDEYIVYGKVKKVFHRVRKYSDEDCIALAIQSWCKEHEMEPKTVSDYFVRLVKIKH